ncbi:MAG TPA: nitrate ABC transporter permease [Acidimicrobiaceae bacterium]|nr:nitrate ABC transporter permease [Acidimicrobiaceae bacterium]
MKRPRALLAVVVPPLVVGLVFLSLWELLIRWRDVQPYVMVKPSAVWSALVDNVGPIRDAAFVTGGNAVAGLVLGTLLGVVLAVVASAVRPLGDLINPLATAVNAVPIVVVVAVLTRMYEADSETPRRIMAMLVVFFVVFVNVLRGLRETNATQLELMKSYAASPLQQFRTVRLPNAMPYLFTGIRVAAPLAVITAVVAEYFGGKKNGLGSGITSFLSTAKKDVGLAYVAGASALGVACFAAAAILEFVAVPWQRRRSSR